MTLKGSASVTLNIALDTIGVDLETVAVIVLEEMQPMLDLSRQLVPVRTGALQSSIRLEGSVDGHKAIGDLIAGNSTVNYAGYVEAGPHARPYLRPAFEATIGVIGANLAVRLKDYIAGKLG